MGLGLWRVSLSIHNNRTGRLLATTVTMLYTRSTATSLSTVLRPATFSVEAAPASVTVVQGSSASYTITVRAFGIYNSSTTLGVTGLPAGATATFSPSAPQPPEGGIATSTLTVNVPIATPIGSYVLNVTGYPPSSTSLTPKWTLVTLNVIGRPTDFGISVSPNSTDYQCDGM